MNIEIELRPGLPYVTRRQRAGPLIGLCLAVVVNTLVGMIGGCL